MNDRIAFQGEAGAFSHQACIRFDEQLEPLAFPTFFDAISAVHEGKARYAMMPIENSLYGRVSDLHHLLPSADLTIVGEIFIPIRLNLMAIAGSSIDAITTARSHAVALGQCREFLVRHNIHPLVDADTAGAARHIAEADDGQSAAIASTLAAEIYGLEILASDVEDAEHNTTRFIIMAREPLQEKWDRSQALTSFVFSVRNVPAALYKALGGFATNGVNMIKLESYMVDGSFTATQFYADIEGDIDDRGVQLAMEELAFFTHEVKILGVYPRAAHRAGLAKNGNGGNGNEGKKI